MPGGVVPLSFGPTRGDLEAKLAELAEQKKQLETQKQIDALKQEGARQPSEPSKIVQANADGSIKPPTEPQNITFKKFENGMVFGFSANPRKPGTFIIHDATGTPYLIALHPAVANMVCQAVTLLFITREANARKQLEEVDKLTDAADTNLPEPGPTAEPSVPANNGTPTNVP